MGRRDRAWPRVGGEPGGHGDRRGRPRRHRRRYRLGPFAGFFGAPQPVALDIVPVSPEVDAPFPFVDAVSMGVRRGEATLKAELDGIVGRRHDEIQRILESFRIPLVPERGK
jgi:hypothetical protein